MTDSERALIERACQRLVTSYCHYIDRGEAARVVELFTEDGVWRGPGVRMEGREQIARGFQARQDQAERMSRHVCQNFLCDVRDDDHAEGSVYLTLYRHDGEPGRKVSPLVGPHMVGEYRDHFARTEEGWRIAERQTLVHFLAEGAGV